MNLIPIVVLAVYLLGVLISMARAALSIKSILALTKAGSVSKKDKNLIIEAESIKSPFSFFKYIFIPANISESAKEVVILHETQHYKQKHSLDLLAHQIWKALCWFNPIVYLLEKEIKNNHEFLVDRQMIQSNVSVIQYLTALKEILNPHSQYNPAHYFKSTNLKTRLNMLTKTHSHKLKSSFYLAFTAVILIGVFAFSTSSKEYKPSIKPIANTEVKSGFGHRFDPVTKAKKLHTGVDFVAPIGTAVLATGYATVSQVDTAKGYGIYIRLQHGAIYETQYAHLSEVLIKKGDKIKMGQIIGKVGNTGFSSGPHLHYEVIENGKKVDPELFFNTEKEE